MRIIDRYICREILSHSLLGLVVVTFVFFVPQLVQLMELVAHHAGGMWPTTELFLTIFPRVLAFTLPIAVLIGVLIGLGRLSVDSELIAMNAVGMGLRQLLIPIGIIALLACALTFGMTLWLEPLSVHTLHTLEDRLSASQASLQVQPRVFDEQFPRLVLYVQDVSAAATRWQGVFLAESDAGDISRLTLAEDAIVIADREQGKLELHLRDGSSHESSTDDPDHYNLSAFGQRDFTIQLSGGTKGQARQPGIDERSLGALAKWTGPRAVDAQVEFHRRIAYPVACLVFALVALPIGARPRRGGRSAGMLIAVVLVSGYYLILVTGAGLARAGSLPPWLGMWAANIAMASCGLLLIPGVEQMPGESRLARILAVFTDSAYPWLGRFLRPSPSVPQAKTQTGRSPSANLHRESGVEGGEGRTDMHSGILATSSAVARARRQGGGFPQFLDFYVWRSFAFYFALLLAAFLVLFEIFTFFELLDDITLHRAGILVVLNYFRYLGYNLFYQLAPLACLVAVLVTLGVMAKNNELVAFKAAGVSLYRIAMPLILLGFAVAAGLIALDQTYLPYANQRSEALRNTIKGRPAQTYSRPQQQWIVGNDAKIYNYQLFDPDHALFGGLNLFELDPQTFALRRRIYAARAHWEPQQNAWILESGWLRDFQDGSVTRYLSFSVLELPEMNEPPGYFTRDVRQSFQMNWWELRNYIVKLRRAGFDVSRLSVQLHKKIAFPLVAPIVIVLAIPFSILVGTRGAVGGVLLGVLLGVGYWATSALLEAMGAVGQLPPLVAAWSPDALFLFMGLYFFLKMPT